MTHNDVTLRPARPGYGWRDIAGPLETAFSLVIMFWLLVGTFAPNQVFRTFEGLVPLLAALTGGAVIAVLRGRFMLRVDALHVLLYVFLAAGFLALILSYLDATHAAGLPRQDRFIVRQAYFLVLLPLALLAGSVLWRRFYAAIFKFCDRYFLALATLLVAADWLTAAFIGDEQFAKFNDYDLYLEKGTIWLLFGFIYLARVVSRPRMSWLCLGVLVIYYAGSMALSYGALFQATTGTLVFGLLALVTVLHSHARLCGQALVAAVALVAVGLIAGTAYPDMMSGDDNAVWRFQGWRANFISLYQTGLVGVGFGTPYFPVSSTDLEFALRIYQRGTDPWVADAQIYDLVYLRTQHNSFVNAFYRTGVVGGLAFALLNTALLWTALRSLRDSDAVHRQHLIFASALFVIGILEISLHVGLETPKFLVPYALALTLLWMMIDRARTMSPQRRGTD
jgi:hypothetical protein